MAPASPPASLPKKSQFFLPIARGQMALSAMLFSIRANGFSV